MRVIIAITSSFHSSQKFLPEFLPKFLPSFQNSFRKEFPSQFLPKFCEVVTLSCGPDNVHPHILNETAAATSLPLSMISKESLRTGEIPEDWRKANITPIFKKRSKNYPANYRPVSLTSQVCKILESIVGGETPM